MNQVGTKYMVESSMLLGSMTLDVQIINPIILS